MDHYTPTGTFVYQYQQLEPGILNDTYSTSPYSTPPDYSPTSAESSDSPSPLVLHAPIPVSNVAMPIVDYFSGTDDAGPVGRGACLYEMNKEAPIFVHDLAVSPATAFERESDLSVPMLQYPTDDTLEHYFPEAAELANVFSSLQLVNNSGSPNFEHGDQAPHVSPAISSEYSGFCQTLEPLQTTFPTPSELLAELTEKGLSVPSDEISSDARSESASKARRRAMAKRVGFVPTDPDTISSHDKKRHYLESLEQYIVYLHEQFSLLQQEHPPLQQVAQYKGLSSRSIRTILVHMENTTRDLNVRTVAEEERFIRLRDEILRRESGNVNDLTVQVQSPPSFRRH